MRTSSHYLPHEWPYWVGGIFLAAINTAILVVLGRPWGVTGPFTNIGGRILQVVGLNPQEWAYFQVLNNESALAGFGWLDGLLWLNLGVVAGALLASWRAGDIRLRTGRRTWRTAGLALGGGVLMGYGTRLALGCNAGALLGGVPSFSLHGWVFTAATFIGVLAGIRLFRGILLGGSTVRDQSKRGWRT